MKDCSEPGCSSPQFGGSFCRYHQWKRKLKGGDLYNPKPKKQKAIPKEGKKLKKEREYYSIQAHRFFDEAVASRTNTCIFCGEKVVKFEGLHHWKGRIGDYLHDKVWWSIPHNDCHIQYHRSTIQQMTEAWGQPFWDRLEKFNSSLREKIQNREEKSKPIYKLNPKLFDEEDDIF